MPLAVHRRRRAAARGPAPAARAGHLSRGPRAAAPAARRFVRSEYPHARLRRRPERGAGRAGVADAVSAARPRHAHDPRRASATPRCARAASRSWPTASCAMSASPIAAVRRRNARPPPRTAWRRSPIDYDPLHAVPSRRGGRRSQRAAAAPASGRQPGRQLRRCASAIPTPPSPRPTASSAAASTSSATRACRSRRAAWRPSGTPDAST